MAITSVLSRTGQSRYQQVTLEEQSASRSCLLQQSWATVPLPPGADGEAFAGRTQCGKCSEVEEKDNSAPQHLFS